MTTWVVSGMKAASACLRLFCGTWEPVVPMQREPLKGVDLSRGDVPRRGTGAECLVVARKPTKVGGAKGARQPAPDAGQLATGGVGGTGQSRMPRGEADGWLMGAV